MRTTGPGQSVRLLLDVIELLRHEGIDYAVIGAIAASVHGVVRASVDADVVVRVSIAEIGAFQKTFSAAGFAVDLVRGDADDPIPAILHIIDRHRNRVDLLCGLRGMEPSAYSRAVQVVFENESLKIIGLEDFVAMKAYAGGPLDIADARRAVAVAQDSLDKELLTKITRKFGATAMETLGQIMREA